MSSSQGQAAWRSRSGGGQGPASSTHQPPQPPPSIAYPPGYPNAPPVQLPPGITHQQWSQGYWRFDPNAKPVWASASAQAASGAPPITYNPGLVNNNRPDSQAGRQSAQPQQGQPPAGWMPHPGWQIPADFNPYKRVPKPPDPTYWLTALSDNPLGLENMHITQKFIEEHNGHTMQTPWVWNPGHLSDEDQQPETSDPQGIPNPTANRHRVASASEQAARGHPHLTQPSSDAQEGDRYRQRDNLSYSGSPDPVVPPGHRQQQQQQPSPPQSQPSNTPQRHPSLSRRHTHESAFHTPPEKSSSRKQAEPPPPQDSCSRRDVVKRQETPASDSDSSNSEDEAFSQRKELHPTFSPAIVRTPKYYSERVNTPVPTPTRNGSAAPVRSASEPPITSSQSWSSVPLVSQLTASQSDVLSPLIGATPRPSSTPMPNIERPRSSHHRSSSSLSKSRAKSPDPSPPPYRLSSTVSSSQQTRTVPRSHTYPTLDPVSEDPFSSTPHDVQSSRNPPLTGSSRKTESKESSSKHSRKLSRSQTYPEVLLSSSPNRVVSPSPSTTPSRQSSRNASRSHTPSNSGSGSGSTLPPPLPPDVLARMQERHPNAVPAPVKVRKGFWNRRGDHLTAEKYIVYAPHNQTNPPDLARYPPPKQGFMDSDGNVVMLDPGMQELPESLPRHGQPPISPYESFVQFERRWHPVDPITPP